MEKLKAYFESIGFVDLELTTILKSFTIQELKKNDFFVEEGKISRHLGFLESGMLQYYFAIDGEEKITYISIENSFVASLLSIISETPSLENIKAITDSRLCLISMTEIKKLVNEIPNFKNFYINLLEVSICGIDASRQDLIVLTGEQRYDKMLKNEPRLLQQIPLQYLASMLGVTPRHLSRIRSNIR